MDGLFGAMEHLKLRKVGTDDEILAKFAKLVMKVDAKALKKGDELIPFLHIVLKCDQCGIIFVYHAPVMGDKEFLHAVVRELPKVTGILLKSASCPDHGHKGRYLGYIFTAKARMWDIRKKKGEDFDKYVMLSVSTKKSNSIIFKVTSDKKLEKYEDMKDEMTSPMINIFDVSHWETDDPMFQ